MEKWPFCKSYYKALWNRLKREDFKMKKRLSIYKTSVVSKNFEGCFVNLMLTSRLRMHRIPRF